MSAAAFLRTTKANGPGRVCAALRGRRSSTRNHETAVQWMPGRPYLDLGQDKESRRSGGAAASGSGGRVDVGGKGNTGSQEGLNYSSNITFTQVSRSGPAGLALTQTLKLAQLAELTQFPAHPAPHRARRPSRPHSDLASPLSPPTAVRLAEPLTARLPASRSCVHSTAGHRLPTLPRRRLRTPPRAITLYP
jgi:hypothetical protein